MPYLRKILVLSVILVFIGGIGFVAVRYKISEPSINEETRVLINSEAEDDSDVSDEAPTLIDTGDWKTYRNKEYGFELRYPNIYLIRNRDTSSPLSKSRYLILNKGNSAVITSITIEIIPSQELQNSQLRDTNLDYINYIKNADNHIKLKTVEVIEKTIPVFYFKGENPGEFGDFRNTIVIVIEHGENLFVFKKAPSHNLDTELVEILSTLRFFEQEGL